MRTNICILASLTLGLLVASCQNGLEEMFNESEGQDEQATTRTETEAPDKNDDYIIIKQLTGMEDESEILEALESAPMSRGTISGQYFIGNDEIRKYSVEAPFGTDSIHWVFNTNIFTEITRGNAWIKLQLIDPTCTTDATIVAYAYDSGEITTIYSKSLGVNGPRTNDDSSLSIFRTSDSAQVYPFTNGAPFTPNTYYDGYYSCNYTVTITDWRFDLGYGGSVTKTNNPNISSYCHFLTDSSTWWYLEIKGQMSPYNVNKTLYTAWLYGQ